MPIGMAVEVDGVASCEVDGSSGDIYMFGLTSNSNSLFNIE
jgi:hypothetical protein